MKIVFILLLTSSVVFFSFLDKIPEKYKNNVFVHVYYQISFFYKYSQNKKHLLLDFNSGKDIYLHNKIKLNNKKFIITSLDKELMSISQNLTANVNNIQNMKNMNPAELVQNLTQMSSFDFKKNNSILDALDSVYFKSKNSGAKISIHDAIVLNLDENDYKNYIDSKYVFDNFVKIVKNKLQ